MPPQRPGASPNIDHVKEARDTKTRELQEAELAAIHTLINSKATTSEMCKYSGFLKMIYTNEVEALRMIEGAYNSKVRTCKQLSKAAPSSKTWFRQARSSWVQDNEAVSIFQDSLDNEPCLISAEQTIVHVHN